MPLALDLFCGGGGATAGLQRAGYTVVGVDLHPSPYYPGDHFIQADACAPPVRLEEFDLIWASPPCQRFSTMTKRHTGRGVTHLDLIPQVRTLLEESGRPYIIENVPGAPLTPTVLLCGSMFGLGSSPYYLQRHRIFETNFKVRQPLCAHGERAITICGHPGGSSTRDRKAFGSLQQWREAMGIDWLPAKYLAQAIPPAYAYYLATQLKESNL